MPTEILMPALSPTMEEGTLAKWLVKEGDTVAAGDLLAEIETDKATMEFEAVDEGVVGKLLVADGTEGVKVNTPIAVLLDEGESAADVAAPQGCAGCRRGACRCAGPGRSRGPCPRCPARLLTASGSSPRRWRGASPRQKGLDLTAIAGSGPHGRIVKADVENATAAPSRPPPPPPAAAAPAAAAMAAGPSPIRCSRSMPTGPSRRSSSTACARPSPRA